jgi:hypothetical protein
MVGICEESRVDDFFDRTGCATIPNGGYYGDISQLGTPGPVLGAVEVAEGLLVETISLGGGKSVNIQINKDKPTDKELLLHDNVLTIGNFSKVIGSGFSSNKDIYYQKRIYDDGSDVFELAGSNYLVTWKCTFRNPDIELVTHKRRRPFIHLAPDRYTIMIQELKQ